MDITDVSGHLRPDACPGALQVHTAADGALARVRIPGGFLTAAQLGEVAACAAELGSGVIELTSRANLQVRGLRVTPAPPDGLRAGPGSGAAAASVPVFAARMAAAGLLPSATHERVRNILASPLAGRAPSSLVDVRPLVADLDRRLCAAPELAALSGRFLFALDDGTGDVLSCGADVTFLATSPTGGVLLLGGARHAVPVTVSGAVPLMLAAASAFMELSDGTAWRVTDLPDGPARLAARLNPPTTQDPGPATPRQDARFPGPAPQGDQAPAQARRGDDQAHAQARQGDDQTPAQARRGDDQAHAQARRGDDRGTMTPDVETAARGAGVRDAGTRPQRDGRVALEVVVPLGRLSAGQATALAACAAEIRVTPWRTVVLPDLPADAVQPIADRLTAAGLVAVAGTPWAGLSACTGRPGCAKSLADVQLDARRWAERPSHEPPAHPVHWAGCERRCGRPAGEVVDVVATPTGYRVAGRTEEEGI
ncbi:precorrin-3B synthase [Nonomuraea sp. NPDC003804]|uniref:precorrin-3B synthase n=1 Tax=Nonomuraea sp. NPDC003804 TaxID=3154547 RepID=UPI0033AEE5FB